MPKLYTKYHFNETEFRTIQLMLHVNNVEELELKLDTMAQSERSAVFKMMLLLGAGDRETVAKVFNSFTDI
jgi:hypothetical protein